MPIHLLFRMQLVFFYDFLQPDQAIVCEIDYSFV